MSKLLDKLMKAGSIEDTALLSKSKFFNAKDMVPTIVPALNIALSGSIHGGLTPGLTVVAGPSKHFKSLMTMIMAKAYMEHYKDAVMIFYDNEFGTPRGYFASLGIDMNRVIHKPTKNVEELKHDISATLEQIARGDKVVIVVDSIGNMASKKEVEDAKNGKSVADMSRAKQIKSLFRIVTPFLTTLDIPMICVNHTYDEMSLFPKQIVSGGTGVMYSADNVWILGRQQQKDKANKVSGYNFVINIEKSRFVKEKAKIDLLVTHAGGIDLNSNLLNIALDGKFIDKPVAGKYQLVDRETGELVGDVVKEKDIGKLLEQVIHLDEFDEHCKKMYQLGQVNLFGSDDVDEDVSIEDELQSLEDDE